jgi:hypothetical protein
LKNQRHITEEELYAFLFEHVDSVPHMEALLQLWDSRPKVWPLSELAARLHLEPPAAQSILSDLVRRGLATASAEAPRRFGYLSTLHNDSMIDVLARAYRTDLVRISTALHYGPKNVDRKKP